MSGTEIGASPFVLGLPEGGLDLGVRLLQARVEGAAHRQGHDGEQGKTAHQQHGRGIDVLVSQPHVGIILRNTSDNFAPQAGAF